MKNFRFRHNDMPWNIRNFLHNQLRQVDLSADLKNVRPWSESVWSHTDLRRLREGRVGAQVSIPIVPDLTIYKKKIRIDYNIFCILPKVLLYSCLLSISWHCTLPFHMKNLSCPRKFPLKIISCFDTNKIYKENAWKHQTKAAQKKIYASDGEPTV